MTDQSEERDLDYDKIAKDAVSAVNVSIPRTTLTWKVRFALVMAAIIVAVNAVIGVYDSIYLHEEVKCNHQLQTALAVVGDQNRNITKNAIDQALSGKRLTPAKISSIRSNYDRKFKINTQRRNSLLQTTCKDGSSTPTPPPTPSPGASQAPK